MKDNNFYLHLEGMDLAGKSSVAKKIQEKTELNIIINNNRLCPKNHIYNFIEKASAEKLYDNELYGYLYYAALLYDLNEFKLVENTIQDSTILLRSINYHIENGNIKLANMFEELIPFHPVPTFSFYLTADINIRFERLKNIINNQTQKISSNDLMIINNKDKFIKMENRLLNLSRKYFNSMVIDTSNLSVEQIADNIIDLCSLNNKMELNMIVKRRKKNEKITK